MNHVCTLLFSHYLLSMASVTSNMFIIPLLLYRTFPKTFPDTSGNNNKNIFIFLDFLEVEKEPQLHQPGGTAQHRELTFDYLC